MKGDIGAGVGYMRALSGHWQCYSNVSLLSPLLWRTICTAYYVFCDMLARKDVIAVSVTLQH